MEKRALSIHLSTLSQPITKNSKYYFNERGKEIISYKFRCYFALLRGLHGLCPCPICLIREGALSDLSVAFPERQEDYAKGLVERIEAKGVKESKLKVLGLRAVKVSNTGTLGRLGQQYIQVNLYS